jgi:acyl carrier protein
VSLETELKELIISSLDLEDITVADIDSEDALFGEGLGLDSIDALELGLAISKKYQVKIDAENSDTRNHFASVNNLVRFIETNR